MGSLTSLAFRASFPAASFEVPAHFFSTAPELEGFFGASHRAIPMVLHGELWWNPTCWSWKICLGWWNSKSCIVLFWWLNGSNLCVLQQFHHWRFRPISSWSVKPFNSMSFHFVRENGPHVWWWTSQLLIVSSILCLVILVKSMFLVKKTCYILHIGWWALPTYQSPSLIKHWSSRVTDTQGRSGAESGKWATGVCWGPELG